MLVYINDKIINTDDCEIIEEKNLENGYYYREVKFKAEDGTIFNVEYSKFTNISDIIEPEEYAEEYIPFSMVKETINYDIGWEDRSYEIEELEEELEELKEDKELQEDEKKEDIEELKKEIEELEYETNEFYDLIKQIDEKTSIIVDNIGIMASSCNDFNYSGVEIDIANGVAIIRTYEDEIATNDISWVEDFLLMYWKWFADERVLKYIVEHKEDFDVEIITADQQN